MRLSNTVLVACILSVAAVGCNRESSPKTVAEATPVSYDAAKYILNDEPEDAIGVIDARGSTKDGEAIVMVGRVGGATNPWVEGRAAFMMLDASKSVVATGKEANGSEICMGDCCAAERADCTALVTVVDDHGQVLPVDSRQLLRLAENDMVLVHGKVKKDDAGNFSLQADGVYVRR